jgi:YesN/AraC family two-component response regulator
MDETVIEGMIESAFSKVRLDNLSRRFVHPSYLLERRLRDHILEGDAEPALAILKEINRLERARLADDSFRSMKNSLIASCTVFTRAAIEGGVEPDISFTMSDTFIRMLESAKDEEALAGLEEMMIRAFVALVHRHRNEHRKAVVSRAVKYVKTHITEEITLSQTAAELGVTEQYLSGRFRKKMGMSFIDYVHHVKIEEAKYYLRTSDLRVLPIAQMLGYSYQAYFARIFKKVTGMTPTEYRGKDSGD